MKHITINMHVTEACNFSCSFCFAHWNNNLEIFRNEDRFLAFIEYLDHQAKSALATDQLTINFAGGEPALLKHLHKGAQLCRDLGIRTSVITNGLLFKRYSRREIASMFDVVGVSIDSFSDQTNIDIGRVDARNVGYNYFELVDALAELKSQFGTYTKVNTVVSQENFQENISKPILDAGIDRWKIFRMLPVCTDQTLPEEFFKHFVHTNSKVLRPIVEDNEDMMSAYIMVNSNGHLYQSDRVDGKICYDYFDLNTGNLFEGLRHVGIDFQKYRKRYSPAPNFAEYEMRRQMVR